MCGFFGIWNRDGRPVDREALIAGTQALRHRGPDDEGYVLINSHTGRALACAGDQTVRSLGLPRLLQVANDEFDLAFGFRRLAILDLSPHGHQPMGTRDGRWWLVYNGEVYNYTELRNRLRVSGMTFAGHGDTEVVLSSLAAHGDRALDDFNGMFALAAWNAADRQLLLARDRCGIKPLYVTSPDRESFAFASEIKALVVSGAVEFVPSESAVANYVAMRRYPSHAHGETFFEGVWSVPPGSTLSIRHHTHERRRYWQLPGEQAEEANLDTLVEEYRALFTDAVQRQLRADVEVGTCLSGGVDSSSIVAVVRHQLDRNQTGLFREPHSFTAVYEESGNFNERPFLARMVRDPATSHEVTPTADRLLNEARRLAWAQDEPFQSTSVFAQWCVMDLARQRHVGVLLDGQGADEMLAGYRPFGYHLATLARRMQWADLRREIRALAAADRQPPTALLSALTRQIASGVVSPLRPLVGGGAWFNGELQRSGLRSELREHHAPDIYDRFHGNTSARSLAEHQRSLFTEQTLPNLLRYEDRNSMAFSIEARVPFLDHRLVEFAFRHLHQVAIRDGWTKWIHRKALAPILPPEIAWRRDKIGFDTPESSWFATLSPTFSDLFRPGAPVERFLDLSAVRSALSSGDFVARDDQRRAWRWVNLALWFEEFSTAEARPSRPAPQRHVGRGISGLTPPPMYRVHP